jgi:hypothetical protein
MNGPYQFQPDSSFQQLLLQQDTAQSSQPISEG